MEPRKSFLLRIDPQLWKDLEAWSQAELRSVNGQIEYLLRSAVQKRLKAAAQSDESPGPEASSSKWQLPAENAE